MREIRKSSQFIKDFILNYLECNNIFTLLWV